jgi:ubiquinone/menaquinone biosynthesis C-methylase UbiE
MKPQVWVWVASLVALGLAMVAIPARHPIGAGVAVAVAAACWIAARRWNQRDPVPFPFAFRALLHLPRPLQSPKQLIRALEPRAGERILEIGPGIGVHALPVALSMADTGTLDVLDVQSAMLREVARRAEASGVTNIRCQQADAARLPYPSRTFDGAYLIGTLGEIPDRGAALLELFRVLKPTGRLVIGEIAVDPDFVSLGPLRDEMSQAGFTFVRTIGCPLAYLARFQRR